MSRSPPLPLPRNSSIDDRGQGGFGGRVQNVPRSLPTPQIEPRRDVATAPPLMQYRPLSQPSGNYATFQSFADPPADQSQNVYQQQGSLPAYAGYRRPSDPFLQERATTVEPTGYPSPKTQRKTKGHVASACVPCKRAHLRCDAQRPCDRCMNTGKEEACIDVQHKKRGRPRLRDEREARFEGMGPAYPPPPEHAMRRPVPLYSTSEPIPSDSATLHKFGSYRVLKSQGGQPAAPHRFIEHASTADANVDTGHQSSSRSTVDQELPCAYLTMELEISRASQAFCAAVDLPSVTARKLFNLVAASDRDKLYRLRRSLEEEQQRNEPNYLPPIYGKAEEERVIQSIGMGAYDLAQFRVDRSEILLFQRTDGQQRAVHVRFGLAKRDSTYFVVLLIVPEDPPPYPRDQVYNYQAPTQMSNQPSMLSPYGNIPQYSEPRTFDQALAYRMPNSVDANSAARGSAYAPSFPRQPYSTPDYGNEFAGSQTSRRQPPPRQSELQLPPIRTQASSVQAAMNRPDDRSGRLDIGVLLEQPSDQASDIRRPR